MVEWNPAIITKLVDYVHKNPVEKRFNTYYIKGVALIQCNATSINITVRDNHLHIYYDPVMNTYHSYSMPMFQIVPNAMLMFTEAKKLCSEAETKASSTPTIPGTTPPVSTPSLPSPTQDMDIDQLLAKLNLSSNKAIKRGITYRKAKEFVKARYPACFYIVRYFNYDKPSLELLYAIYAKEWTKAESILTGLAMECTSEDCVARMRGMFDECRKVIISGGKS